VKTEKKARKEMERIRDRGFLPFHPISSRCHLVPPSLPTKPQVPTPVLDEFVRPDAEARCYSFTQLRDWALTYQDMNNNDPVIYTVHNRYLLASVSLSAVIDGFETVGIDEADIINVRIINDLAKAIMECLETKKRMRVVDKMGESLAHALGGFYVG